MRTSLSTLHHQAIDWLRELEFYTVELSILSGRLNEVMSKTAGDLEAAKQATHFQNKFVLLREQTDVLAKDIKTREEKVEKTTQVMPGRIDEHIRLLDDKIFDRMAMLSKGIAATRYEFNKFLSKIM